MTFQGISAVDKRQKAIEELKKQIKLGRERLGPAALKELEKLAKGLQKPKSAPLPPGMVPYDRKSAAKVFEIFLKNHGDPKGFQKKLLEMLKKTTH